MRNLNNWSKGWRDDKIIYWYINRFLEVQRVEQKTKNSYLFSTITILSLSLSPFGFSPNLSEPPFTLHLPPFYRHFPLLYPQLAYFQLVLGDTCHITFMFYHPFIKEKKKTFGSVCTIQASLPAFNVKEIR